MKSIEKVMSCADKLCSSIGVPVGRILIALLFLLSGINKIMHFDATAQMMANAGMPFVTVLLVIAIIIDFVAPLALIFGYQVRNAVRILILYTIIATAYFHTDFANQIQMIMFMKNIAIIGGLMILGAGAPGCKSCTLEKEDNK